MTSAPDAFFRREFPGLAKYERNAGEAVFHGSFRTDGVSASVVLRRSSPHDAPQQATAFRPGRGLVKVEGTDLQSAYPPVVPQDGQRTVGIDPGRRDMIVGVVYDPASRASCDAAHVIKMSTRRYVRESGRAKAKRETEARLARARAPDGVTPLDEALQCVPSARVASADALPAHLRALVPLLGAWLAVHRVRAVRRARFAVYSRRDASLDTLCHRICGGQPLRRLRRRTDPTADPRGVRRGQFLF